MDIVATMAKRQLSSFSSFQESTQPSAKSPCKFDKVFLGQESLLSPSIVSNELANESITLI